MAGLAMLVLAASLAACQAPATLPSLVGPTVATAAPGAQSQGEEAAGGASLSPAYQTIYVANTGGDGVVLRSAPSMTARTDIVYRDGTALIMHAQVDGWAKITAPQQGFIPPPYWTLTPPVGSSAPVAPSTGAPAVGIRYVAADGDGLFVRSRPDMDAKVRVWPDATAVAVLSEEAGWCNVRTPDGYVGYMPARFLVAQPPATGAALRVDAQATALVRSPVATGAPTIQVGTASGLMPGVNVQCRQMVGAEICASVSTTAPRQKASLTVFGRLTLNGKPQMGQAMSSVWRLKDSTVSCGETTDGDGLAVCERSLGRVASGFTVSVDVRIAGYTTRTSFTPQ